MSTTHLWKRALLGAALAAAISAGLVWATTGTGTTSMLIGRATFEDRLKVKRVGAEDWDVKIEAKPALDIAVQRIVFQPGGQSGWHSHPGPVFISVVEGRMTFYESDDPYCEPVVRSAGQGFLTWGPTLTSPATRPRSRRPTS